MPPSKESRTKNVWEAMRKLALRLLPLLVIFPLLSTPPFLRSADSQTAWVKRVVGGDMLLLTNGKRVRLIGVDTPEVHESRKLYRDAERSGRDMKTIKGLGRGASEFT